MSKLEQAKQILQKAQNLEKGKEIALAKEFISINDKVDTVAEKADLIAKEVDTKLTEISDSLKKKLDEELSYEIDPETIKGEKGERGEKGEKGDKGEQGIAGKDGNDGKDGLDGKDGVDGKNGLPGANGSPDTGEQIVDKINELPLEKDKQIDFSHIKNAPEFKNGNYYGSSGIKEIIAGTNVTVDNTNLGYPVINSTATATGDMEASVYDPDGGARQVAFKDQLSPGGLISNNVYFTTIDSDITGYKKLSYLPEGTETELSVSISNGEYLARTYLYDDPIDTTYITAGTWYANFTAKIDKTPGVTQIKFEAFLYHTDTTETTLFSVYSSELNNTDYQTFSEATTQLGFSCVATDRFGIRIYFKTTSTPTVVINTIVGDGRGAYFNLPILPRHSQLRARDEANSHPASAIQMDTLIGTPTYPSQNDFNNSFGSAGRKTGGIITDATGGYIAVSAGTGYIKATDDDNAQLIPFDFPAPTNIEIPSSTTRYIGVEYNAGTPRVVARTSFNWNKDSEFSLGRVINEPINGTDGLHIISNPWWVTDGMTNVIERIRAMGRLKRDDNEGGLMLSVTGTRKIAVTAGTIWSNLNEFAIPAIDTNVSGTVEYYWYSSTGGWQDSDATSYSATQYNDPAQATLQNVGSNKYYNTWVYAEADDLKIALVYGQADYATQAAAAAVQAPSLLPVHLQQNAILIGRIIARQGVTAPILVQSAFTTMLGTSTATNHNALAGLQGGAAGEYYHLTSAEYTALSKEKRHDWVAPNDYCGTAPLGSSESASVWTITRIVVANDGTTTTTTLTNVKWSDRLTIF